MSKSHKSKRTKKDQDMYSKLDRRFHDEFGETERFGNEIITQVNIADADLEYTKIFGANKNLDRAIPNLCDGLKPSKRRLFYSWWELIGRPQNTKPETLKKMRFQKVDKLASNTVNYHPHGTSSINDILGKEGQYWSNNVMTIVPQGAFGNFRGDSWAAGRYLEANLSEYTIDCFFDDFDKYCVQMKLAYTGDGEEPVVLPSKYPHILFNPQLSGIGFGSSSNIPSFNITEVLDATIKLIKNPKAKVFLIPDFSAGCDIVDNGEFEKINETGKGKILLRATSSIDYTKNIIHISSLPYNGASKTVIENLVNLKLDKKKGLFQEIVDVRDRTKEGEVDIDICLKSDAQPDKILALLYKKVAGLKATFPVGLTVIDDYEMYEYNIKELLLAWIEFRVDAVRSMFLNNLQTLETKKNMLDVLLYVFNEDNIDKAIAIAKSSKSRKETMDEYMRVFHINSLQASVIADMHVYNFNKDSYEKYKEEKKKIKQEHSETMEILYDENKLESYIIKQLEEGKKKYGHPRKSMIVKETDKEDDDIPDVNYLIGVSETGFVKKVKLHDNAVIGPVGKTNSNTSVLTINNRDNLIVVDSSGYITKISVSGIPEMKMEEIGVELRKFFPVKGSIKAIMELPKMDMIDIKDDKYNIITISKMGYGKRVKISEYKRLIDTKVCMNLYEGDELATAIFDFNQSATDIVVYTNQGNGIRIQKEDINMFGAAAKGVQLVSLKEGEEVIGASLLTNDYKYLFMITNAGRGKITEEKYFPCMKRREDTMQLINIQGSETLIGLDCVSKKDTVMIYKKKADPENVLISDIKLTSRMSKGEKLVKLERGDLVVGYKVFHQK